MTTLGMHSMLEHTNPKEPKRAPEQKKKPGWYAFLSQHVRFQVRMLGLNSMDTSPRPLRTWTTLRFLRANAHACFVQSCFLFFRRTRLAWKEGHLAYQIFALGPLTFNTKDQGDADGFPLVSWSPRSNHVDEELRPLGHARTLVRTSGPKPNFRSFRSSMCFLQGAL